jgi:thiamine biosynthesis protein ThiS
MPDVRVNGDDRSLPSGATVETLVRILEEEGLALDRRAIAVEVNREVVPRSTYTARTLAERDEVEIVTIVGGG